MKQIFYIFILTIVTFGCTQLNDSTVQDLLEEAKAYPKAVEYRMHCDNSQTAKKADENGLAKLNLLTANFEHTLDDIGEPLIHFTDKATPYLIATSDTLKSFYIQRVKVADEEFHKVVQIQYSPDEKLAVVTYMTRMVNVTPFEVMLRQPFELEQRRETTFTLTAAGWRWDGKIRKLAKI
jgi:hypothetical protein